MLLAVLALSICSAAKAQELDGTAVMRLAIKGAWQAEHAEYGYWSWADDNTVCLRLGSPEGNCADTGTWAIRENALCYELTWWGETADEKKACFTVRAQGGGRYETVVYGTAMASTMYYFKVLE